jgi:hypothetical protein
MRRSCLTLFVAAELWGDRSVTEVEEFIAGARRLAQVHMPPCARKHAHSRARALHIAACLGMGQQQTACRAVRFSSPAPALIKPADSLTTGEWNLQDDGRKREREKEEEEEEKETYTGTGTQMLRCGQKGWEEGGRGG